MRILVTNDDGIDSLGLHYLARAMTPLGDVVVAAPDGDQSGAGAAISAIYRNKPQVKKAHIDGVPESWAVAGPPGLCAFMGRLGAFGEPFDLVVSGINPGANVGRSVYHSGTIGACLTARNGGLSGVAVSQAVSGWGVEGQAWDDIVLNQIWETPATVAQHFVKGLLDDGLPEEPIINSADLELIKDEHSKRLRSLLSVDDLVRELHAYLESVGEWDNTFFFATSDRESYARQTHVYDICVGG